jgi:CubicO group peptidase (beta-lactamase class C family)
VSALPRSTPEEQGISSAAVGRLVDALETQLRDIHSLMLVRHGHVIAEGWWAPYAADLPHSLFSVSKSFTSAAVGLAIDEGRLTLDDLVVDLLPDSVPATVSDTLGRLSVRHLLTMTTGHATDSVALTSAATPDWTRALLALPVDHEPGTHFVYDTGATFLLSAILQRLTGERLLDYLTPRLFEPLGIVGATWEQSPLGIDAGGWGLSITTEDIAKFGLLYLDGGRLDGRQVVPEQWVRLSTSLQVENGDHRAGDDWSQGYGFQFWRSQHGTYRADGAFGQFSIAFPEHDTVLVLTAGLADSQRELEVVWQHLLPVLGHEGAILDAPADRPALQERLGGLSLVPPSGAATARAASRVTGRTFLFGANAGHVASITLSTGADQTVLTVVDATGEHRVECGFESWTAGRSSLMLGADRRIAAAGAWADDDAFVARIVFTETPFSITVSLDFAVPGEVTLNVEQNVSFGPTQLLHVTGHAE